MIYSSHKNDFKFSFFRTLKPKIYNLYDCSLVLGCVWNKGPDLLHYKPSTFPAEVLSMVWHESTVTLKSDQDLENAMLRSNEERTRSKREIGKVKVSLWRQGGKYKLKGGQLCQVKRKLRVQKAMNDDRWQIYHKNGDSNSDQVFSTQCFFLFYSDAFKITFHYTPCTRNLTTRECSGCIRNLLLTSKEVWIYTSGRKPRHWEDCHDTVTVSCSKINQLLTNAVKEGVMIRP